MKLQFTIMLLIFWTISFAQENAIIKLAFSDKTNFDITTFLDHKKPTVFYVLKKTDKWNIYRFHMDKDLTSDSVRKRLERDEYSPYNHSYIFRDTVISRLFSDSEKQRLFNHTKAIQPKELADTFKVFKLIKSFSAAKIGFFFSVSEPIFTQDKQFAFVDIITYKKDKETKKLNYAYFGTTIIIYQYIEGKGWTRIKKRDHLLL